VKKGATRDGDGHGSVVANCDVVWSREGAGGRESTVIRGHMSQCAGVDDPTTFDSEVV
jgi:hypothetical protein